MSKTDSILSQPGKIRMQITDTESVIHIDGVIGSYDFWGDYSAKKMRDDLAGAKGSSVRVVINSPGGEVNQGVAIYDALKACGKKVVTQVSGVAASIASIIFLAGSERNVSTGSFVMVHNALCWCYGNAAEMRKLADDLDKISGSMMDIYAAVTGSTPEKIKEWMDAETWFNAAECAANGFATAAPATAQAVALAPFAGVFAHYRNTPPELTFAPTAGAENNNEKTPNMGKDNKPAGDATPRADDTTDALTALTERVGALETSVADIDTRLKAVEGATSDESANAKAVKALRSDVDAIKAKTPAAAPVPVPPVAGAKDFKSMSRDELMKHYDSLPQGEKQRFYSEHIKPKL